MLIELLFAVSLQTAVVSPLPANSLKIERVASMSATAADSAPTNLVPHLPVSSPDASLKNIEAPLKSERVAFAGAALEGFFSSAFKQLITQATAAQILQVTDGIVQDHLLRVYDKMNGAMKNNINYALYIYMALFGIAVSMGHIKMAHRQAAIHLVAVAMATWMFNQPQLVQEHLYRFATEAPSELGLLAMPKATKFSATALFMGKGNAQKQLKRRVAAIIDWVLVSSHVYATESFKNKRQTTGDMQFDAHGAIVRTSAYIFALFAIGLIMVPNITIGMFIALLPLFVVLYLLGKIGRGMMQAWIKIMLNCMFTILFASMVLGVCFYLFTVMPALQAMSNMVVNVLGQLGGGKGLADSIIVASKDDATGDGVTEMFLLSIWLCIYFLKQVPGYAAAITGITVNSAYEMGHSIEHAGFAPGGKGDKHRSHGNTSEADKAKREKVEAAKSKQKGKG